MNNSQYFLNEKENSKELPGSSAVKEVIEVAPMTGTLFLPTEWIKAWQVINLASAFKTVLLILILNIPNTRLYLCLFQQYKAIEIFC